MKQNTSEARVFVGDKELLGTGFRGINIEKESTGITGEDIPHYNEVWEGYKKLFNENNELEKKIWSMEERHRMQVDSLEREIWERKLKTNKEVCIELKERDLFKELEKAKRTIQDNQSRIWGLSEAVDGFTCKDDCKHKMPEWEYAACGLCKRNAIDRYSPVKTKIID